MAAKTAKKTPAEALEAVQKAIVDARKVIVASESHDLAQFDAALEMASQRIAQVQALA